MSEVTAGAQPSAAAEAPPPEWTGAEQALANAEPRGAAGEEAGEAAAEPDTEPDPQPRGAAGKAGEDAAEPDTEPDAEPRGAAGTPQEAGWRESLRVGLWTWLAGVAMYVLVTLVSWMPTAGHAPPFTQAYQVWHRWDTTWYVIIADSGYGYDRRSTAFFPLYPLLIRAANHVLPGGSFEAALILSVLTCFVALVMVHRLTVQIAGAAIARRTAFYLLAFPTGFYLAAAYNESLFIALAAGSLYFMRRQRWWLAAVLAGFASGTRMAGALLAIAFLYEYVRQRRFALSRVRWDLLWVALTPAGLLLYAAYCYRAFGDPLFFEKMQTNWFHTGFQAPWTTLWQVLQMVVQTHPALGADSMRNIINLTTAVVVLIMLLITLDRERGLGKEQAYLVIFSAGVILMPLVNPIRTYYPLSSMWRFALECLPVFMVLGKMGRNRRFDRVYTMAAIGLQGVMILTFLQNQFVA